MHEKYAGKQNSYHFKYDHLYKANISQIMPFFQSFYRKHLVLFKPPFQGTNPLFSREAALNNNNNELRLEFDSNFESGNLDLAVEVADNQYDLFMRVDSNT